MNKKIIFLLTSLCLLITAGFAVADTATLTNPIGANNFVDLLNQNILPAVSRIVGSLAVIMFIVAGILYLTSAGDSGRMTKAKTALTYAVVGLVIALMAESIALVLKETLGVK